MSTATRSDGITPAVDARPKFREFHDYVGPAVEWVKAGNVAITPGIIERISGGAAMYLHAPDVRTFAIASRLLEADPSSVPAGRTGCNLDGEYLLRALIRCKLDALGDNRTATATRLAVPDPEPWNSRCPECRAPFDRVGAHTLTASGVAVTSLECANRHRWPL